MKKNINIIKQKWISDRYRYPYGEQKEVTEPNSMKGNSPGFFDQQFIPRETTHMTGPGISSHFNTSKYISSPNVLSHPSTTRESKVIYKKSFSFDISEIIEDIEDSGLNVENFSFKNNKYKIKISGSIKKLKNILHSSNFNIIEKNNEIEISDPALNLKILIGE